MRVKTYGSSWAHRFMPSCTRMAIGATTPTSHTRIYEYCSPSSLTNVYQYHWAEGVKFMLGGLPSSGRSTDSLDRLDGMYGS